MAFKKSNNNSNTNNGKFKLRQDHGSLFENENKKSDKSPDYTGRVNLDGIEYWVSAWIVKTPHGSFLSFNIGDSVENK